MTQPIIQTIALLFLCLGLSSSFAPIPHISTNKHLPLSSSTSIHAIKKATKPTFNKQTNLWEPAAGEEAQLDNILSSLLRQGPGPFIVRLTKPTEYEQAVLKYQATEGCSLLEAQGNMDAFFNNAADWAYQKNAEKNGAPKVDYTKLKIKDGILALAWAFFIMPFLGRIVYLIVVTGSYGVKLDQIFEPLTDLF